MEYFLHIAILVCIYIILGISFNLLMGYGGLFSMAHAAMFGIGGYASALFSMKMGMNPWLCMLVAAGVNAAAGAVIAFPALRVKHYYLAVVSFGFQMVVYGLMVNLVGLTGGESGLIGIPRTQIFGYVIKSKTDFLIYVIPVTAFCFILTRRLTTSPFGRVLKAMRDDEEASKAIGKNVLYFKMVIFMVSGAIAGVAGSLYAHYVTFINPSSFTFLESVFVITIVLFGGVGNLWGSVLGAIILVSVPELLRFIHGFPAAIIGPFRVILYGSMLVLMIRFRAQGILPEHSEKQRNVKAPDPSEETQFKTVDPAELLRSLSPPQSYEQTPGEEEDKTKEVVFSAVGLRKHFGGIKAVQNLDVHMEKGKITGLIGPNGAGKTTFFNLVTGFIRPDEGIVSYKGKVVTGLAPNRTALLGFTRSFQDLRLFPRMTVLESVMVARPKQRGEDIFWALIPLPQQEKAVRDYAMELLKFVGLAHKRDVLTENLSFPEQKLLALARLLATNADLFLLDEPTSGLDRKSTDNILDLIKLLPKFGKTICIVQHNLDVIRNVSDWVYFMAEGRVIKEGTPDEIFSDPKLAEIYFGGGAAF